MEGGKPSTSINANTPEELSKVKYKDLDEAIKICLKEGKDCHAGKSDMSSAFRHLGIAKNWWKFLVMKAKNPEDNKWYYFVDKCLPFGASISCSHFQRFSNAVAHIVKKRTNKDNVNYLDDFLFIALLKLVCNNQLKEFLQICKTINFPVSMEKTFWASQTIIFLGILIDCHNQIISIPMEKIIKGRNLINKILNRKPKKTTPKEMQEVTGFLNFLGKCIVPGRAFTRRLYACAETTKIKPHHHMPVNREMKLDLEVWLKFLDKPQAFARPFFDFASNLTSKEIDMFSDSSRNKFLGCGGYCGTSWFMCKWDEDFIESRNPSINYLELYAVTVGVVNWIHRFSNKRVTLFCDNLSVVHMINNNSSKCANCMVLIRIIVMQGLMFNVRISAKHVSGKLNRFSDLMSRMKYKEFRKLARTTGRSFERQHTPIPECLWPMENIWLN